MMLRHCNIYFQMLATIWPVRLVVRVDLFTTETIAANIPDSVSCLSLLSSRSLLAASGLTGNHPITN